MKKLLVTLAAVLVSVSSFAQGTITFDNRGLSERSQGSGLYNAAIGGVTDVASARAQLYLVTGSGAAAVYTPLTPLQTFRPNAPSFFVGPASVSVTGQPAGTTGLTFVVRAWQGAATYEAALAAGGANNTKWGESALITVASALGGTGPGGVFLPPDIGGPNGLQPFNLVPEPSTIALGVLGAAALLYRRRK